MMFQLSCSLSLVLNIFDMQEAKKLRTTYNICLAIVGGMCTACGIYEYNLDAVSNHEHMIWEALALIVLCLIYFSTIVELLRKLQIFVLAQAKIEAILIRVQFIVFFVAYGSKVATLLYWMKNPPSERIDDDHFLVNQDIL